LDIALIIIPFILIIASQAYINNSYKKYEEYDVDSEMSGYETARLILDKNNLKNVNIVKIKGQLTDNYNPKTNTISLSESVYEGRNISSVSVAAHESCHVIQHKEKYAFIIIRGVLVPIINLTSKIGYVVLLIGFFASIFDLAMIGLILMAGALVFQLITLPTEYNASGRAKKELIKLKIIDKKELPFVRSMLNAAAFTYLASFFASILQILRLFLNINRRD
jgi:hypothetical protein